MAASVGRFIAFLFILGGVWLVFNGQLVNGLWIAFIGWFLESAAHAELRQVTLHNLLSGHTVSQAMSQSIAIAPAETSLQKLVDDQVLGMGQRNFLVETSGKLTGMLNLEQIRAIPKQSWPTTTVAQVMAPLQTLHTLQTSTDLWQAVEEMDQDGVSQLPVVANGRILGVLSRQNIVSYLGALRSIGSGDRAHAKL